MTKMQAFVGRTSNDLFAKQTLDSDQMRDVKYFCIDFQTL